MARAITRVSTFTIVLYYDAYLTLKVRADCSEDWI